MNQPKWISCLNSVPGTLVSAGTESIQVYPFAGLMRNLVVVLAETHPWVDAWRNMGIRVFCLADQDDDMPTGNTGRLLLHKKTLIFLKSLPPPVTILMFKPDAKSTDELISHGFRILGCDPGLARRLENKLIFPEIVHEAGLSMPVTQHFRLAPGGFQIGNHPEITFPFVCQFAKGFSGNRTFLVRSEADWGQLINRFSDRNCRISRWLNGETWTANACIFKDGTMQISHPFLQETRVFQPPDDLPPRLGSRGNRWGTTPANLDERITMTMQKLGSVLFKRGFWGFFGADLLVTPENEILAIEINPRITASTPVLTPLEMEQKNPPLIAGFIAASMDVEWPWRNTPSAPPPGGQLIFRPDGTVLPKDTDELTTGVYRFESDRFRWIRDGHSPVELVEGECLIWKPVTSKYSSEIMRIIYRNRAACPFPASWQDL